MTTSNGSDRNPPTATRVPLRLRMAEPGSHNHLDGGWWPQGRDLAVELADLVDHFPERFGRVVRAVYSPPDWDEGSHGISVGTGFMKVGSFPRDDTHMMVLKTSDRRTHRLLVVPPHYSETQAEEALEAASSADNTTPGVVLLEPDGHAPGHTSP